MYRNTLSIIVIIFAAFWGLSCSHSRERIREPLRPPTLGEKLTALVETSKDNTNQLKRSIRVLEDDNKWIEENIHKYSDSEIRKEQIEEVQDFILQQTLGFAAEKTGSGILKSPKINPAYALPLKRIMGVVSIIDLVASAFSTASRVYYLESLRPYHAALEKRYAKNKAIIKATSAEVNRDANLSEDLKTIAIKHDSIMRDSDELSRENKILIDRMDDFISRFEEE